MVDVNKSSEFAQRLLHWFDQYGRHDLPWQSPRTAYRVWLSEVMLQQTQVATVRDYFQRFVQAFPNVQSLAEASSDAVMAQWAGLGYYSRARNLHATAKRVRIEFAGEFPSDLASLQSLPGIGRSTAAAIRTQAFDLPAAILDGNVKRVLARHLGLRLLISSTAAEKQLWQGAENMLPAARFADYTQAQMDLGALICTPKQPQCNKCPVALDCQARLTNAVDQIPVKKARKKIPTREVFWLVARDAEDRILLERRPPTGIWGGLYCLPQTEHPADFLALPIKQSEPGRALEPITHVFTHFRLVARPILVAASALQRLAASDQYVWASTAQLCRLGLPKPVRDLLMSQKTIRPA